MELKDESIRLLKKRMHHQMSVSSENDIKPENIQYYVSSLIMQKEDMYRKESICQREDMYHQEDVRQEVRTDGNKAEASEEESEAYEEIPSDIEYIKKLEEIPPAIKDIKVPETMEARHERAKNEYEKVLQAVDEEEIFGIRKPHWLNIKG